MQTEHIPEALETASFFFWGGDQKKMWPHVFKGTILTFLDQQNTYSLLKKNFHTRDLSVIHL